MWSLHIVYITLGVAKNSSILNGNRNVNFFCSSLIFSFLFLKFKVKKNQMISAQALLKVGKWNFFAMTFNLKKKKGILQVGDSFGYNDGTSDFPVRTIFWLSSASWCMRIFFVQVSKQKTWSTSINVWNNVLLTTFLVGKLFRLGRRQLVFFSQIDKSAFWRQKRGRCSIQFLRELKLRPVFQRGTKCGWNTPQEVLSRCRWR